MKLTWKNQNKKHKRPLLSISTLPFDQNDDHITNNSEDRPRSDNDTDHNTEQAQTYHHNDTELAEAFHAQGNKLAEDGRYHEALGKWEAAITLMPERAVLHEQKAQVLLEIGEAWNALKAATRATELEPSWAEAWITLGRAQLNFGEPDNAIESFDRALAIKPDFVEALDDWETASHLVKKRKQFHSSGSSTTKNRYVVGDKTESS
ncbi:hypothetical protein HYC85_021495 [Camellia sinensis]|uniref:Tetratricopeptide repeat protein 33 n=1 Tax=Camellia sinensis TaxID=4442 RepID=A0A7J7GLT6_CAMSI|nr:hypothetical protein HYC85_021495 [Camellia sinensis]